MKVYKWKHSSVSALALMSMSVVLTETGVTAQDAEQSTDKFVLEEIIITSRKVAEGIQSVPISVTALGTADIERRSMADLRDVGRFTPNVYFSNIGSASPDQAAVFIRGVGQAEAMITGDPGVGIYIDGVYLGRAQGGILDMLDMERIEVLRGPQGTLFGKNTIGGAINIVSAAPQGDGSGKVSVTYGNIDRLDVSGSVDIGLADGLSLKVSALAKNRGCLYNRVSDGACYGDENSRSVRAFLRYEPSDDFKVDIIADHTNSNAHSLPHGVISYNPDAPIISGWNSAVEAGEVPGPTLSDSNPEIASSNPYATEGNRPTDAKLETYGVSLVLEKSFENMTLHSITAYRDVRAPSVESSDGSAAQLAEVPSYTEANQFSQEFRLEGTVGDFANYVAGLYYFSEEGLSDEFVDIPLLFGGIGWEHYNEQKVKSYAGFLQSSINLGEKLRATVGLRYTDETKNFIGGRRSLTAAAFDLIPPGPDRLGIDGLAFDVIPLTASQVSYGVWSPKFGLDYQFNDDVMVYGSISKGFRAGGFNPRADTLLGATTPYLPESVWSYELGFKSDLLDRRLRLNGAVFFSDYQDRQQTILRSEGVDENGAPRFSPVVANGASAEIRGFELETMVLISEELKFEANVGYTDAKFTKIAPEVTDINLDSVFTYTPKWTWSAAAEYSSDIESLAGEVTARVDYSYRGSVAFAPNPQTYNVEDSVGLLNARVAYSHEGGDWELAIYGRNLTNKIYKLWANDLYNDAFGLAFAWYSDPREYGIMLTRKF